MPKSRFKDDDHLGTVVDERRGLCSYEALGQKCPLPGVYCPQPCGDRYLCRRHTGKKQFDPQREGEFLALLDRDPSMLRGEYRRLYPERSVTQQCLDIAKTLERQQRETRSDWVERLKAHAGVGPWSRLLETLK